jgi:hypothetical protein
MIGVTAAAMIIRMLCVDGMSPPLKGRYIDIYYVLFRSTQCNLYKPQCYSLPIDFFLVLMFCSFWINTAHPNNKPIRTRTYRIYT